MKIDRSLYEYRDFIMTVATELGLLDAPLLVTADAAHDLQCGSYLASHRTGHYEIYIHLPEATVRRTLAHELRHVHQRVIGRLAFGPTPAFRMWEGKLYVNEPGDRAGLDLPWELDANEYEAEVCGLTLEAVESYKLSMYEAS